jgi:hypothetical protein
MIFFGWPDHPDGPPHSSEDEDTHRLWWGYWADLRHAGVLDAARAIHEARSSGSEDRSSFLAVRRAAVAGIEDMGGPEGSPLPSCMQKGRLGQDDAAEVTLIPPGGNRDAR